MSENRSQILTTPTQHNVFLADFENFDEFLTDGIVFIEEMHAPGPKCPKFTSEYGFADIAIISSLTIETLLTAVVDAGNA